MRVAVIHRSWGEIAAVIEMPDYVTPKQILNYWCDRQGIAKNSIAYDMVSVTEMKVETMLDVKRTSKFMSLVLRHQPELLGLTLEEGGWVRVDDLLSAMKAKGKGISREELNLVVATNDKKRFSFSEDKTKIRANQGHSVEVDLQLEPKMPPDVLHHGTATRFLDKIYDGGLQKMSRHHVHLSQDPGMAKKVGERHGHPVVLNIDAKKMVEDGFVFFQSDNGVWLVDSVPNKYIVGGITTGA